MLPATGKDSDQHPDSDSDSDEDTTEADVIMKATESDMQLDEFTTEHGLVSWFGFSDMKKYELLGLVGKFIPAANATVAKKTQAEIAVFLAGKQETLQITAEQCQQCLDFTREERLSVATAKTKKRKANPFAFELSAQEQRAIDQSDNNGRASRATKRAC
jgi:hypothetical protein